MRSVKSLFSRPSTKARVFRPLSLVLLGGAAAFLLIWAFVGFAPRAQGSAAARPVKSRSSEGLAIDADMSGQVPSAAPETLDVAAAKEEQVNLLDPAEDAGAEVSSISIDGSSAAPDELGAPEDSVASSRPSPSAVAAKAPVPAAPPPPAVS